MQEAKLLLGRPSNVDKFLGLMHLQNDIVHLFLPHSGLVQRAVILHVSHIKTVATPSDNVV